MKRIIDLHKSLYNYLKTITKKKDIFELYKIYRNTGNIYLKNLWKEYIFLLKTLDPAYKTQVKNYNKYQQYRKDLYNAWKLLHYMIKKGKNKTEKKQIKRDFEKYGKISKELENEILKDLYGVKQK